MKDSFFLEQCDEGFIEQRIDSTNLNDTDAQKWFKAEQAKSNKVKNLSNIKKKELNKLCQPIYDYWMQRRLVKSVVLGIKEARKATECP